MAGAGEGLFLSLYEGCISGDITLDRRPYHRNCQCALHDKSRSNCPHALPKTKTVSYPLRRAWSEGCLSMETASSCQSSPSSSPAPLPRVPAAAGKQQLGSYKEVDDDDDDDLFQSTAKGAKMNLKGN